MPQSSTNIPQNDQSLKWRFDVNTFRLLGRDLITDRVTAVFELVKNCYDANATEVNVDFSGITTNSLDRKLIISDNGIGMSFIDIRDKWMVVGTNSKRINLYSEAPFNRKFVGEKGIGRFAVDKLGERVQIRTKQKGEHEWLCININWDEYEHKANLPTSNQLSLFTEVENKYIFELGDINDHGTSITISNISETWTKNDIERLYKELSKLVSPFYKINPPFNITINSNEFEEYSNKLVKPDPIKFYSHYAEIDFDLETKKQETLQFDTKNGKIYRDLVDIKSFGPIKMKLFYFNESAKRRYNVAYKNNGDTRIDGIKIYRDGVIATPFAEFEDDTAKRRDILGIDKRRWRSTFDKIGTREIIGILDITKALNPRIVDATNRQDFLDYPEYRHLKEFIIEQVDVFSKVKDFERDSKRTVVERELQKAGQEIKSFTNAIAKIEREILIDKPEFKDVLAPLKQQADLLSSTITQSINEQKKYQKDVVRKENIFLSLMSLQDYATNISHAIRTSLGKIKRLAEFFKINFPNPKFDNLFKQYAILIYDEMNILLKVTDFMLSYASSEIDFEDFSVKELIEDLINNYEHTFKLDNIRSIVEIKDDFIVNTNKKFFQDIFQNLIANSIKALNGKSEKIIKCSGFLDEDNFTIYFSDNGCGVKKGDEKWIFELYNTRTAEQGGAGLGLYVVEKRIEALKGTIELVTNEFEPTGATFKIKLPFNKNSNEFSNN